MRIATTIATASAMLLAIAPVGASASPGYDFVCFDRQFVATIGFDLEWSTAYMTNNWGEFELKATEGQGGPDNSFSFADDTYAFRGIAPEGQIVRGDTVVARCHQSRDSLKNLALYASENGLRWSSYEAPGTGRGNVRRAPSVFSEKIGSLGDGAPVTIRRNTDQFLDGFFWFQVDYDEGETGYVWGALLCTDADVHELRVTLRRCP